MKELRVIFAIFLFLSLVIGNLYYLYAYENGSIAQHTAIFNTGAMKVFLGVVTLVTFLFMFLPLKGDDLSDGDEPQ